MQQLARPRLPDGRVHRRGRVPVHRASTGAAGPASIWATWPALQAYGRAVAARPAVQAALKAEGHVR
ncbi:MAG: hypothetical protein MZW92_77815 [Comamonadaceae bacterium]|nr:hypothetical protein [Comamonadaceae bacterium]